MLKVIKRVLRLSGDLSKRIYASFVFSFIDSIMAMFPVGAVFYTLTKIQNNKAFAGNDWLVLFGILIISLVVRMVFKYLVYSFQSTAGFEFVSRQRITLGDKLRNVGMGFFHERNMGDITTTVTTDLNFLENYSMHLLDRVTTGMVNMVVTSIFILMFDCKAKFDDKQHSFVLKKSVANCACGKYDLLSQLRDGAPYRLSHPLAQYVLGKAIKSLLILTFIH